jgi:hypothetical protein
MFEPLGLRQACRLLRAGRLEAREYLETCALVIAQRRHLRKKKPFLRFFCPSQRRPPLGGGSLQQALKEHLRHKVAVATAYKPAAPPWMAQARTGQEQTYACAASVVNEQLDTLILPHVNVKRPCLQIFLDEIASRHPD